AAAVAAVIFLLVAAFVWLADLYDALTAGVVLGCAFALIALIALVACLMTRRRNMERARLELAAPSGTSWFDPKLVAIGLQIPQAIGWRGRPSPPPPAPPAGGPGAGGGAPRPPARRGP